MKKMLIALGLMTMMVSCAPKTDKIDQIVGQMTLEEKARVVVGAGGKSKWYSEPIYQNLPDVVPGVAGAVCCIDRLGVPFMILSDGPAGVNLDVHREGDTASYYCTHFPIGTLLASTWNVDLVESVGAAIGDEAKAYGIDAILGPGMNIHRHPLNGRNFEYYSEDPLLSGRMAAAYVRGVQHDGVAACIKHYLGNNQETNRMGNDVRVSERALREIYLRGFEIAVKEGQPKMLMTSYNKINGVSVSESRYLVTDILRGEWEFDGVVVSDWLGGDYPVLQMQAGNDLLEPGRLWQMDSIIAAVKDGRLDESVLDTNVKRILRLAFDSPRAANFAYDNHPDLKGHAAVTRQSATEGMVLLKNDQQALPLSESVEKVALFGSGSYDFIPGGTGSGDVNRAYTISMLDGLRNAGYQIDEQLTERYQDFVEESREANTAAADEMVARLSRIRPDEMPLTRQEIEQQAKSADVAIVTFGRSSGEYYDRPSDDFYLSSVEKQLLDEVCNAFHQLKKEVIVVLNVGGVIETDSWKNLPDAILCAWQAGQEGGNSVVDILSGKECPSGKLPMTFPIGLHDAASSANFPIDQKSDVVSVSQRRIDVGEKNVDFTNYEEGILVGYRWFDKQEMEVSYPFGFGLSYTSFEYGSAALDEQESQIVIELEVQNVGEKAGKEVVQLYVAAPDNGMDNPVKELKAFAKTSLLQPGEKTMVKLIVNKDDLASFDEVENAWVKTDGTYQLLIGSSSRDIRVSLNQDLEF